MTDTSPGFFARLGLAFRAFFGSLGSPEVAASVGRVLESGGAPRPVLREAQPDAALQLLGLLQREGRFVDFLEEDVDGYGDAEIGAAARVVHQGCRKALREHLTLQPVRPEPEGTTLVLPAGYDAAQLRLVGNVSGQPPFRGTLRHRGWRATDVRLPRLAENHDPRILAAAEVEL